METQGSLKIKLFGNVAEALGADEISVAYTDNTGMLREHLFQLYPRIKPLAFTIALNKKLVHREEPIKPSDEIALLPPFSGG